MGRAAASRGERGWGRCAGREREGRGEKTATATLLCIMEKEAGEEEAGEGKNGGEGGVINKRRMSEGKIETKEETEKERERN